MGRLERPRLRGTLLGTLLRLWNPVMQWLLRSPLHRPWSRWFLVIEWRGRETGRRYRTPVSYVRDDNRLLLTTGDTWWKNLVDDPGVRVWVDGRARRGTAEPIVDEEESVALHRRMFAARPLFAALAGIGRSEPDRILRSIRAGRRLISVRLHDAA